MFLHLMAKVMELMEQLEFEVVDYGVMKMKDKTIRVDVTIAPKGDADQFKLPYNELDETKL